MLQKAQEVFRQLDSKAQYVHFKSNEHLNESFDGDTDFDVLVRREDASNAEEVFLSCNGKRFIGSIGSVYPGVDDWLFLDETGKFIHFHVHYQLITGKSSIKHVVLPWTKYALENRIYNDRWGLYTVSPEFELCELFVRIIVKSSLKRSLRSTLNGLNYTAAEIKEHAYLIDRIDDNKLEEVINILFGDEYDNTTIKCIIMKNHLNRMEYKKAKTIISKFEKIHNRIGNFVGIKSYYLAVIRRIRGFKKKIGYFESGMLKKSSHASGLMVAFVGSDGAGKSTICSNIIKWLGWKLEVSSLYMGSSQIHRSKYMKILRKIINVGIKNNTNQIEQDDTIHNNTKRNNKRDIKSLYLQYLNVKFARKVHNNIIRSLHYKNNGGIMILDRFPQTSIDGIMDGPKVDRQYKNFYKKEKKFLDISNHIQPDIVFILDVPLETAIIRKPDHPVKLLKSKIDACMKLEFPLSKVIHIDTTQDFEQELIMIKKEIWKMI